MKSRLRFWPVNSFKMPSLTKSSMRSGGVGLGLDKIGHHLDVGHRRPVERSHERLSIGLAPYVEARHVFTLNALFQRQNVLEHLDGQAGRLAHAEQKEPQPRFQRVRGTDGHQLIVILALVPLEEVGEIQRGLMQEAEADQIEHDEQTAQSSVPVEERMDGLELLMDERNLEKVWDMDLVVVHELFQIAQEVRHMPAVGRNKCGVVETDTDPVLAGAKFSWLFVLAPYPAQQDGVSLAQEPVGQGHLTQLLDGEIDRLDVVVHFLPVITFFRIEVELAYQRLFNVGLGALDAAGCGGFLGDVHPDEEIHVRDELRKRVQLPKQTIGLFQERENLWVGNNPFPLIGAGRKLRYSYCCSYSPDMNTPIFMDLFALPSRI